MTRRLWIALACSIPLVGLGIFDTISPGKPVSSAIGSKMFLLVQAGLCIPLVLYCATPFLVLAWQSIRTRRPTLDTLIGLGVAATFIYSLVATTYAWSGVRPLSQPREATELRPELRTGMETLAPNQRGTVDPFFESVGMLVLLALVGKVLELRASERSRIALSQFEHLAPKTACVILPNGQEEVRSADAIRPGDLIRVQPGERIPVDGIIHDGKSTIDESMLTGEPTRVEREKGGRVLAGSENGLRPLVIEAAQTGHETILDQVVTLVSRAREVRGILQRTTDRVFAWYVPAVLLVAAVSSAGWAIFGPPGSASTYAAVCAIGVFVVACPCAVGLTTAASVIAMRRAAGAGVLFREATVLERLAAVDTILFDKTGTLTEGRPRLLAVVPNSGRSENAVLTLAAAIERGSEHPLGLAIVWEAARRELGFISADSVVPVVGKGVRGVVDGQVVSVGRLSFIQESGTYSELMLSEAMKHRYMGHIVVFVGEGKRCAGLIVFNDPIRASAAAAVEQLQSAGLKVALVTGDHMETAREVARLLGIGEVIADALPIEKFAVVQKFKGEGRVVAMCGEGINDAPALGAADVGISPVSGTEAAIGVAGVTLVHADLRMIETARELSRATVRTIRWNLVLAFTFNVLAIPIAAGVLVPFGGGLIDSFWATTTMSVGSLAVLANSFLLYFRLPSFRKSRSDKR